MNVPGAYFSLFGIVLFAAFFLSMVCLEFGKMSGGKLKFLEESNEKLAARLDSIFPFREEWFIAGRMAVLLLEMVAGALLVVWWNAELKERTSESLPWILYAKPIVLVLVLHYLREVISCSLGVAASARLLLLMIPLFRVVSWLFFPITIPVGRLHRHISEVRTKNEDEVAQPSVEDEILSLVEGEEAVPGVEKTPELEEDERRLIVGAFELDEINVRRIMTPRVEVVGVEYDEKTPLSEFVKSAKQVIVESGHSRIPVYEGTMDNVIGIVYSKDLLDDGKITSFESLVHRKSLYIPVSKNIGDLLAEFRQNKMHLAIVVDEYGGTAGVVTFEDVLETLLGDIKDEYDGKEGSFDLKENGDGKYICDARMPIHDVNRRLNIEIPEDEEYDTLGGYVSAETGRIPKEGENLHLTHLQVYVRKADSRHAIELEISRLPEAEEE